MRVQEHNDLTMKRTFENILLILSTIGVAIIILNWIL